MEIFHCGERVGIASRQGVLPMLAQGRGCIIFIASPTGMLGFTQLTAYSTSKGGAIGLMRAMAADYAAEHIRVNAIVPGAIDTPMNAPDFQASGGREKWAAAAPVNRLGTGEDVAGMVVFMASDDADYCQGGLREDTCFRGTSATSSNSAKTSDAPLFPFSHVC